MSPELDERLCQKYPLIFQGRTDGDPRRTLMCYGFCHGDGWFNIIENLSAKIQTYCDEKKSQGEDFQVVAVQVKEKFGGLRFYVDGGDEYTNGLIRAAEDASYETCEDCGVPGTLRKGGWWATLCDKCDEERNAQRHNR